MSLYKCDKCGKVISELPTVVDYVPYGDTNVPLESEDECCRCGGVYEEAFECKECGEVVEYTGKGENHNICPDCLKKKARDLSILRKAYQDEKIEDSLIKYLIENSRYTTVYDVLWDFIEKKAEESFYIKKDIVEYASTYVEYDLEDFAERLDKEGLI